MRPAMFELSADARFLRQELQKLKPGEEITYGRLSQIVGKEVRGSFPALQSARRGLVKDGFIFSPVRGEGIRRLTDNEVVDAASGDITRMRRHARRAGLRLSTVEVDKLTPEKQVAFTAKASIIGAVSALTTEKAIAKVEKVSGGRAEELPIAQTLKALGFS